MGYHDIRDKDGNVIGTAIVCTRGGRNSGGPCSGCKRWANALLLCDFPVLRGDRETTCDRRICRSCARAIGPNRDLCPSHAPYWDAEKRVFTVGPQAAPPLKPFVEPPDPKAEANRTGAGFAEPVSVPADAFKPITSDEDLEQRLLALEPPEEP